MASVLSDPLLSNSLGVPVICAERPVTPDDLLRMPDGVNYELVDGKLVERNAGMKSSWIGGLMHHFLSNFSDENSLGWVWPADASFQCFADAPSKVRKPDVAFIRFGRLPGEEPPPGHCPIAPDLAVEIVSPNDLYSAVEDKVAEYLDAGVRLVWVVNPSTRTIRVHRANATVTDLDETDELSGEDVLPGFVVPVAKLFVKPGAVQPTS